jgi:hypothetical protein
MSSRSLITTTSSGWRRLLNLPRHKRQTCCKSQTAGGNRSIGTSSSFWKNNSTRCYASTDSSISTATSNATTTITKENNNQQHHIVTIGGKDYDDLKQIRLVRTVHHQGHCGLLLGRHHETEPTAATAAASSSSNTTLASICVKRNIIFGSRVYTNSSSQDCTTTGGGGYIQSTLPLMEKALGEASREGDQPQGLAALNGLSCYVRHAIQEEGFSPSLEVWRRRCCFISSSSSSSSSSLETVDAPQNEDAQQVLQAVTAVATQIPRKGHSVVGIGTYCDARKGWTDLAKEYATISELEHADRYRYKYVQEGDASLFQRMEAIFVNIEYIGLDENPEYWKDAGGAMARFFFM